MLSLTKRTHRCSLLVYLAQSQLFELIRNKNLVCMEGKRRMRLALKATLAVAVLIPLLCANAPAAVVGTLKAGAARVEITPDPNAIPRPYTSILDPIYARAIYLENGHDRAVLLNADIGAIATTITENVSSEISRELNVPAAN